jgi:hypothetical protein
LFAAKIDDGSRLPLQAFELGDQTTAPRFQRRELLQLGIGLEAAPGQRRTQDVHLFAEQAWIEHKNSNRICVSLPEKKPDSLASLQILNRRARRSGDILGKPVAV